MLNRETCERFDIVLEAEPCKLDIKRLDSGILFIILSVYDLIIDFCVDSVSLTTSFKK